MIATSPPISVAITSSARETIASYGLVDAGERVMVALSGGKDSLLLSLVLQGLGVDVVSVVVDMGYETGWADRIRLHARSVGVEPRIVTPNGDTGAGAQIPRANATIATNLVALKRISANGSPFTPCTYCYNVKVLELDAVAVELGIGKVAFGHHHTDASASLLKEALMHVDRWDRGHATFERARFAALVDDLATEARSFGAPRARTPLMERIGALVAAGGVDTDEPPRQPLRLDAEVELVRPLFEVDEETIASETARLGLPVEGSGCGHGATAATQTPREMVHHRVLRGMRNPSFQTRIRELVAMGVTFDGRARVEARRRRAELLGGDYKPTVERLVKL